MIPCLSYRDARAAIDWLVEAFGFTEVAAYAGTDRAIEHAELAWDNGMIMLGSARDGDDPLAIRQGTGAVYVIVQDPDAHHARAVAAGAEIVRELQDMDYGSRDYAARDLEGNLWSFGTYRPDLAPHN